MRKRTVKELVQYLKEQSAQTMQKITTSKDEYRKYLDFAARLHKYPLNDALLIYAQNPNAQAVGTRQDWERVGRSVKPYPTPIHVFGRINRYYDSLYELSQTQGKTFSHHFQYDIPNEAKEMLINSFNTGLPADKNTAELFGINFKYCVEEYVEKLYTKTAENIEDGQSEDFKQFVKESVGYVLCQRFGVALGIYANDSSFNGLEKFKDSKAATDAAKITQEIAKDIIQHTTFKLREIKAELESNKMQYKGEDNYVTGRNSRQRGLEIHPRHEEILGSEAAAMVQPTAATGEDRLFHGEHSNENRNRNPGRGPSDGLRDIPGRADIDHGRNENEGTGGSANIGRTLGRYADGVHGDTSDGFGLGELQADENETGPANDLSEVQLALDGASESKGQDESGFAGSGRHVGADGLGYSQTSEADATGLGDSLQQETPSPADGKFRGESELREQQEEMDRRNHLQRLDLQQLELNEEPPKEPINNGSFLNVEDSREPTHAVLDDWSAFVAQTKAEAADYTEPFVVINWSESPSFTDYERLTFTEADLKFKTVEAEERAETLKRFGELPYGYNKTNGVIFYKENPADTELSTYGFRYDIGDYSEEQSGLYNHINNFWTNVQRGLDGEAPFNSYISGMDYTQENVDDVFHMLSILHPVEQERETDIPQSEPENDIESAYLGNPMWQDYSFLKNKNPNNLLFYRLGDFYEAFNYDARIAADALNLTLTSRDMGLKERMPMVGFPMHKLDEYVETLTNAGHIVSIRHGQDETETRSRNIWTEHEQVLDKEDISPSQTAEQSAPAAPIAPTIPITPTVPITPASPPPVFFVDWNTAQHDFDLNHYQQGDIIGYNKEGVEYKAGRVGGMNYITETGAFWGGNEVPGNIYDQLQAYNSGELSADDVRANYLKIIDDYRESKKEEQTEFIDEETTIDNTEIFDFGQASEQEGENWVQKDEQAVETDTANKAENTIMPTYQAASEITATNFTINGTEDIGIASGKTKFNLNLEAIKTLKTIEAENRPATEAEQATLAKYSGFGGIPQAFDPNNAAWEKEHGQLKETATEEEYRLLRGSTLNAHYTSIEVVKAMYDGLEQLGFKGGTILEPCMGTGYFFGAMPKEMAENSRLYGVELDSLTGRIAQKLYPNANIQVKGFEEAEIHDNFHDVAIGNVPFGSYKVHDPKFNKHNFLIHDYFFAKSLDKVRSGGVIAFVTSSGTMDKANSSARKYIAERAELLGAIRLPNTAFKQAAGTEVTTDILFLQKRDGIADAANEDWMNVDHYDTGAKNEDGTRVILPLNRYYIQNPHMMLGEMAYSSNMYGSDKDTALLPFSKPDNNFAPDAWLTERFQGIREYYRGELNYYAYQYINEFEKAAKEHGYFNLSVIEEMPVPAGSHIRDPLSAYDIIFDYRLEEIVEHIAEYIEWKPKEDKSDIPLETLLQEAVSHLPQGVMSDYISLDDLEDIQERRDLLPADPSVKNHCFCLVDDKIYRREDAVMFPIDISGKKEERLKAMLEIRVMVRNVIDLQNADCTDEELSEAQQKLSKTYDAFFKSYGSVNAVYNRSIFGDDADYHLLASLENINEDTKEITKTDIFTKRTIVPYKTIESADTAEEALAVSLYENGRVDIGHMQRLTGKTYMEVVNDLQGLIFKNSFADSLDEDYDNENILYKNWETADEYLSGKVVDKLEYVKSDMERDSENFPNYAGVNLKELYAQNEKALEIIQPTPLAAHEISVNVGASWVDPKYYRQFLLETINPNWGQDSLRVDYLDTTNRWNVNYSNTHSVGIEASQTYGTKRMNAYALLEKMLNKGTIEIRDAVSENGKKRYVLNKDETIAIKDKATYLNEAFKKWIFDEPQRREELTAKYNRMFNAERARVYDGSFLRFAGMNPEITLNQHQKDAVARNLFGGNALLAHCVGAGKTYTMAATAMEMRRMGIANKPCVVVPNHLVNQWTNEFKELYPGANILTATKKDFTKDKRKIFTAKIATGDWDAVIIPQSFFERIPVSKERQENKLRKEVREAEDILRDLKNDRSTPRFSVKQIEASLKSLEAQLQKLKYMKQDDLLNFEDTGIDALFVDEAHAYKNKNIFSKMSRVPGLVTRSNTKRSKDMELKIEYVNEKNYGERNVCFATGTPISNSMVEMYTMQSYLQKQTLAEKGHHHFDNWAADFGKIVSQVELAPSGQSFRTKERFSQFDNVQQMMTMFRMAADIKTPEMLNLPVPELKGGKPAVIDVEASESQKELVKALVKLSEKIASRQIPPEVYNMLVVTNHGSLGALDMRTININDFRELDARYELDIDFTKLRADDSPASKVNTCVNKVYEIYKNTEQDKLTQMIFCDKSTPNNKGAFTIYQDIKDKLIAKGVKAEEIAFIHDAKSNEQKEKIFSKMRTGEIRILLGSTSKMGTGTNAQRLLCALHNLDAPWRPSDLEQRGGRILRQGNLNEEVEIFNYVTKGTFDAYLWQIIEGKQKFISQVMSGKINANSIEEQDVQVLNFAEVKAIATGNPLIKRKMELEMEVNKLKVLERQHMATKYQNQDNVIKVYPRQIASLENLIKSIEADISLRDENSTDDFVMRLGKKQYNGSEAKKDAGKVILQARDSGKYVDREIGLYRGFKIVPQNSSGLLSMGNANIRIALVGNKKHIVELGDSETGAITRIDNAINALNQYYQDTAKVLSDTKTKLEATKAVLDLPFEYAVQLADAQSELTAVNAELDIGKDNHADIIDEAPQEHEAIVAGVEEIEIEEDEWEDEV